MMHVSAFYQNVDPAGVLLPIAAVREESIGTAGVDLRVPTGLANIIGAAAICADASVVQAQVQSPSLRMQANLDVAPLVSGAAIFGSPPEVSWFGDSPVGVVPDEAINFAILSDPAAPAVHYGLLWLSDGAVAPTKGNIFTVRCTATIQQVPGVWVNGALAFDQTLPAGRYAVVGMRARSTTAVAMRLVFPEQTARPGVPVVNAIGDLDNHWARFGRAGVFGEFPHTTPPSMDVLGGAVAVQVVHLDLMRLR